LHVGRESAAHPAFWLAIPTPIAEGGMRFTLPPYGKKIEAVKLQNNYLEKSLDAK
jgi:hypothetical protein